MRWRVFCVALVGLVSTSRAIFLPRNETSGGNLTAVVDTDPRDECPGYKVVEVTSATTSLTARLELAGEPCDVYGSDLQNLTLKVTFEDGKRTRWSQELNVANTNNTRLSHR